MEKLVDLLNEYRKQNTKEFFGDDGSLVVLTGKDFIELNRLIVISKEYGFIERLVKNNKINIKKAKEGEIMLSRSDEENIIGKLSIQNNPIDYLCSILK